MNNNFILTLIFLIIIFVLYKNEFTNLFKNTCEGLINTTYFDNDANYQYNMELEKKQYNDYENDKVLLVGKNSTNNNIFKHKNELYTVVNNKLILYNTNDTVSYFKFPTKVPTDLSNMTLKVKMFLDDYKYIGTLTNNFYNQEYLLYEKPYDSFIDIKNNISMNEDSTLYYYILVKIINGKYTIMYKLSPRSKILHQEYIWASYGSFQIGPLLFN